jgi:hypothetical protein
MRFRAGSQVTFFTLLGTLLVQSSGGLMASKLQKLRRQAFRDQQGRCVYCSQPLWEEDIDHFVNTHGIRKSVSKHLQCTAEHLIARKDRGLDVRGNIAAACLWCNQERHRRRPGDSPAHETYGAWVRARVAQGKWHPAAASVAALQTRQR